MSTFSYSPSRSQLLVSDPQSVNDLSATSTQRPRLNESKKPPYQLAQQVKFLHLQVEVECLLQQLQTLKQQRLAADGLDPS